MVRTFLASLLLLAAAAFAADYPSKPIRIVVPFAVGGGNDGVARAIAHQLQIGFGQPVVVENRAGAGGVVGAEIAAKSPPDGYTIFLGGVGSHAINPSIHKSLPYDPIKDFVPVSLIGAAPLVLVVNASFPANTLEEFIAYARAHPGEVNYASNGNGSSSHLAAAMFETATGTRMTHVPYKGLSPALVDLLGGNVQAMFNSVIAILPQVQAGKVKAIAVTGRGRLAQLPNVPAVSESVPGYQASSWYGILVPAGTPPEIVKRLHAEIVKAMKKREVVRFFEHEGAEPIGSTPEEFAEHIRSELEKMGKVARAAKIEAE